ncbi:hypothetical protein SGRIM128S_02968 [Streptomyces griseomycini]
MAPGVPRTAPTASAPVSPLPADPPAEAAGPLERGLTVLRLVADAPRSVRPGDLARATGLARSTVDRITATLTHLDYLRAAGRDLAPAPRLMEFGNAYLHASGASRALRPSLERLARALDESVSAIVLDGCDARIVGTAVPPGRVIPLGFRVGDLLPAERCAAGAVLATGWRPETYDAWRARRAADPLDENFPAVPPRRTAEPPGGRRPTSPPGPRRPTRTAGRWTTSWSPRAWSHWRSRCGIPTAGPSARSACSRTPAATAATHCARTRWPR